MIKVSLNRHIEFSFGTTLCVYFYRVRGILFLYVGFISLASSFCFSFDILLELWTNYGFCNYTRLRLNLICNIKYHRNRGILSVSEITEVLARMFICLYTGILCKRSQPYNPDFLFNIDFMIAVSSTECLIRL